MQTQAELNEWIELALLGDDMTEHQYLRKHILEAAGIPMIDHGSINYEEQKALVEAKMNKFFELCKNRILMGRFRYGPWTDKYYKQHHDCVPDMKIRLDRYDKTRNLEHLIDTFNFMWIEYEFGNHPDKHFESIDDGPHSKQE